MPINMHVLHNLKSDRLELSFSTRLQHTGSDYVIYANTGYVPREGETELLQSILGAIFTDDSGVYKVSVLPFALYVYFSKALRPEDIVYRVKASTVRTQRTLVIVS